MKLFIYFYYCCRPAVCPMLNKTHHSRETKVFFVPSFPETILAWVGHFILQFASTYYTVQHLAQFDTMVTVGSRGHDPRQKVIEEGDQDRRIVETSASVLVGRNTLLSVLVAIILVLYQNVISFVVLLGESCRWYYQVWVISIISRPFTIPFLDCFIFDPGSIGNNLSVSNLRQ